ncbi:MAG: hypothetical protein K8I02_00365, partial [Candidatus Methylomirabilis sp.]|nr:hypothetical protein [Deltaproteobacteria bacterium]
MILEVRHRTRFAYSRPVFLDPLTVRLRPRSDCTQNVLAHTLRVEPEPAGSAEAADLDGASTVTLWFAGGHDRLEIEAWSRVETLRTNPFDFIVTDPGVRRVPACYARETEAALAPYLRRRDPSVEGEEMARRTAAEAGGDTSAFLLLLARRLPERVMPMTREHGAPWSPD